MKKLTALFIAVATCSAAFAAEDKPAETYLPKKGDIALGFDVLPLFRTIGNSFAGTDQTPAIGGTVPDFNWCSIQPTVAIQAKYMLSDKWGLKTTLGLLADKDRYCYYVVDDKALALDPLSKEQVIDSRNDVRTGGTLQFGAEYHLGKRRVQGIFGMGILLGFSSVKSDYSYGNKMTAFNQTPTTHFSNDYIVNEHKNGNFVCGIYGSTGIEWFVAPKIALGATVDLYLYGIVQGQAWTTTRSFSEAFDKVVDNTHVSSPGDHSLRFGTDNLGGSLYMTFYF